MCGVCGLRWRPPFGWAAGWSFDQILEDYPDLEREDITQALKCAAATTNVHFYRLKTTS